MDINKDTLDYLKSFGIKPSVQRLAVMDYLLTHTNHPTVDDIYQDLVTIIPTVSKTTIYNTLRLFYEYGAVLSLNIDEKFVRYDGDISAHAHFRCRKCEKVFDLFPTDIKPCDVLENLQIPTDYQVDTVELYFKGICSECLKKLK